MRFFLNVLLLLVSISIGKFVSGDCLFGTQNFATCTFAPWSRWNCHACCLNNQPAVRRRDLCCGNMLAVANNNRHVCYNTCSKIDGVDNIDSKPCSTVCTCTTSTSSTTPLSTPSCVCPLPTAMPPNFLPTAMPPNFLPTAMPPSTTTESTTSSSTTSPTTSSTSSTSSTTSSTIPSTTPSSTTSSLLTNLSPWAQPTRKASMICFEGKDDIYKCGPRCKDSADWDGCIRSCTRELYETVCELVSLSLFILGVIVGTLCTCVIKFICKRRKKKIQRRVTPKSAETPDGSLSMITEEPDGSELNYPSKLVPW